MESTHRTELPAADSSQEGDPRLAEMVRFVRRHWIFIVCGALATAIAVILGVLLLVPPRYRASATLIVVPPGFASDLKPPALSLQGYQRLLESGGVLDETTRKLTEQGLLEPGRALAIGRTLETRIYVSRRSEETPLAPIIEAVAVSRSAEEAAAIANAWAEAFLNHSRKLVVGSTAPAIELIESIYSRQRTDLEQLSEKRLELVSRYLGQEAELTERWDRKVNEATVAWDRKLVAFKKETEDRLAEYQTATRRMLEESAGQDGVDLSDVSSGDPEHNPAAADAELEKALRQVVSLRVQVAQTPRLLLLEKAVTDEALWQALALSQGRLVELQPLTERSLLSQEVNPVYTQLALRLAEVETGLQAYTGGDRKRAELLTARLEQMQRERSAGLAKLLADRAVEFDRQQREKQLELERLQRQRRLELAALDSERNLRLAEIDRDLDSSRQLFTKLAASYNQVLVAKAEQKVPDVRLGSPAVPPIEPQPRRLAVKGLVALILGGLLSTAVALVREVNGRAA